MKSGTLFSFIATLCLFTQQAAANPEVDEMRRIAALETADEIPAAFKGYPEPGIYSVGSLNVPEGATGVTNKATVEFKTNGYFVSHSKFSPIESLEVEFLILAFYDEEEKIYRKKFLLLENGKPTVINFVGSFDSERRVASWTSLPDDAGILVSVLEFFEDDSSLAKEIVIVGEEVTRVSETRAEKIESK